MASNIQLSKEALQRFHNTLEERGPEFMKKMLGDMHVIRAFEERAELLYAMGKVHGTMHLSIGQEGNAVGASNALEEGDYLLNHHRGHGHCLAWGSDVNRMMAEFMGKESGYCRGRGGSMHIADVDSNNLGANGIVAGGVPISVGVGLSIKMRKTDQVCMVIFGDGAANEGALHEAMNMASIWDLPVIFLCENNQYAMSMPMPNAFNVENISDRAAGYGMPGQTVDGNDVLEVYTAVREAAARARRGEGPSMIEAVTYRYKGHSKSDKQAYRTRDEVNDWKDNRDPIMRYASILTEVELVSQEEADAYRDAAVAALDNAVEFSEESADPEISSLFEGVYAP
ncbi:MAG: thiamine pyrophosphate-dependent dehydrogenase E1 component subunit alpha [Chloroflexota bacterium]